MRMVTARWFHGSGSANQGHMGFRLANVNGRAMLVDGDDLYDVAALTDGELGPDPLDVISHHARLHDLAAGLTKAQPSARLADVTLGPPVPNPCSVFGIGINYRGHAAETGAALPEAPLVFAKFPNCLVGPTADIAIASDTTDYEAELVIVIGAKARGVSRSEAWNVVAGLTAGQDVSDRRLQNAGERPQFSLAKSHDTYGPIGPWVVSPDLLPDRDALDIRCEVNGEARQDDTTGNLIFTVPDLVAYLSENLTLQPGDLIFTGTPSGVGFPTGNFLKAGDLVRTSIGGIGEMVNHCT
jgi:2,4-diketo-3-deoxy-L-fuconate hydrolase